MLLNCIVKMLNILLHNVELVLVKFHFFEQGLEVALYIMQTSFALLCSLCETVQEIRDCEWMIFFHVISYSGVYPRGWLRTGQEFSPGDVFFLEEAYEVVN